MKFILWIFFTLSSVLFTSNLWAQQPATKVTLGIKPDYLYNLGGKGVKVKGIIKGGSAEIAGIKQDDIILAFDNTSIKDIFAYKDLLSAYNRGDKVTIKVRRDQKYIYLHATFK